MIRTTITFLSTSKLVIVWHFLHTESISIVLYVSIRRNLPTFKQSAENQFLLFMLLKMEPCCTNQKVIRV